MLVLSRGEGQRIIATGTNGERVAVTIIAIRNGKVRLGFDAPESVKIHREEVQRIVDREEGRR